MARVRSDQDNEHFRTYLVSLTDDPAFTDSIEVNGSSYLRFNADGTYERFYDDFGMAMGVPDRFVTTSKSAWEGQYGWCLPARRNPATSNTLSWHRAEALDS